MVKSEVTGWCSDRQRQTSYQEPDIRHVDDRNQPKFIALFVTDGDQRVALGGAASGKQTCSYACRDDNGHDKDKGGGVCW